ncbi:hypothetical protein ACQPZF_26395 [Actinosynnema sp. CS-041913]|uniref:hypothetical protein n=1 Tax=Actinosynnema sp. CS-041913 TaxID=3239917 RepID=UPI003D93C716
MSGTAIETRSGAVRDQLARYGTPHSAPHISGEGRSSQARAVWLPGFGDIAVDQAHQRVFVSGGPTANGIVITVAVGPDTSVSNFQYGHRPSACPSGSP